MKLPYSIQGMKMLKKNWVCHILENFGKLSTICYIHFWNKSQLPLPLVFLENYFGLKK